MRARQAVQAAVMLAVAGVAMAQQAASEHAGHVQPAPQPADEHAGHSPPATQPADEHAGHGAAPSQHAGHAPTITPVPALTDADRAAARPPAMAHEFHDNDLHGFLLLDRLETWRDDGATHLGWEAKGWLGTDLSRLWIRSEGERAGGRTGAADMELLYGRSLSPWWDVVGGLRHDFAPDSGQTFAAIGLQGLAPQRYEIEVTAYFGQAGQSALRLSAERELLITNRLIAQGLLELTGFGQDDARRGIAAGPSSAETGVRLRYEFTRRIAPYVGIGYERALGDTADLRRARGEAADEVRYVAGFRTWF